MCAERTKNINQWDRITASDYLQVFLNELSEIEQHKIIVCDKSEVFRIKGLLQAGLSYFKSLQNLHNGFDWYRQEMDFVESNLGRGYLVYFLCNKCGRRVKFLYYRPQGNGYNNEPLCRICNGLKYPQPSRRARRLARLLNKTYKK